MKKHQSKTIAQSEHIKIRIYTVILILLFLWGIALRSVELINGNFLFGLDHGRDYLAAYSIVENHKLTLIGAEAGSGVAGINGIFHGPGYFYLISLAYVLFQGNPYGAELFMVLFGIFAMAAASWVGYQMSGRKGSVLSLFFVTVSPLIVSQSRFIWSSHPLTVFVILAVYFVYRIPDNPRLYAPIAIFISGFTYHSQLGVAVPLTASVILSLIFIYRIRDWRVYAFSAISLACAFLPMILFEMRHGFMAVRAGLTYIQSGGGSSEGFFNPKKIEGHTFDYWNNFYNTFTYEFGWIPWNVQLLFLKFATPFVAVGLYFNHAGRQKKCIYFLLLMIVTTWIGFLFLNNTVWDYYLTHTRIAYIFLFVLACTTLIDRMRDNILAKIGVIAVFIFITVVFTGSVFRQYITYTLDLRDMKVIDKIKGKKGLIDDLYRDANGKPFSVFIFVPPIYTYPYDYLFKTYGKKRYGYEPGHEKSGLAYLIIEPDTGQPWRQKGWLETVVQGGITIWKKTILNGVIVEKRMYP